MSSLIKNLIAFVIGGAFGAAGAYVVTKRKCEKISEETISEMSEYYSKKLHDHGIEATPEDIRKAVLPEKIETDAPKDYVSNAPESSLIRGEKVLKAKERPKVDYTKFYGKSEDEMAENEHPKEDDYYYEGLEATKAAKKSKTPKFIKAVDFGADPSTTTVSLLYYQDSRTLVIEDNLDEEIIEDMNEVEAMIGDALTKYGFDENEEPVIYIRNENRNTDYEITKVFGSYGDL